MLWKDSRGGHAPSRSSVRCCPMKVENGPTRDSVTGAYGYFHRSRLGKPAGFESVSFRITRIHPGHVFNLSAQNDYLRTLVAVKVRHLDNLQCYRTIAVRRDVDFALQRQLRIQPVQKALPVGDQDFLSAVVVEVGRPTTAQIHSGVITGDDLPSLIELHHGSSLVRSKLTRGGCPDQQLASPVSVQVGHERAASSKSASDFFHPKHPSVVGEYVDVTMAIIGSVGSTVAVEVREQVEIQNAR